MDLWHEFTRRWSSGINSGYTMILSFVSKSPWVENVNRFFTPLITVLHADPLFSGESGSAQPFQECEFYYGALSKMSKRLDSCEGRYRILHDDVIQWKHFPCYWPFVRGIHRSPVNSPRKASDAELWLSKQSWGWSFGTSSRSLWRHCNVPCSVQNVKAIRQLCRKV